MTLPKLELKKLMSEEAKEAIGHGVRAKRSKSAPSLLRRHIRAISFDFHETEAGHAAL